jgi:hypothetical protein
MFSDVSDKHIASIFREEENKYTDVLMEFITSIFREEE